jgi:hypothetical protein
MRGEDEDAAAEAASDDIQGYWNIPQSRAWILLGNPDGPLPAPDGGDGLFDRAEAILAADLQQGRVMTFGRPQPKYSDDPVTVERRRIEEVELLGEIVFNPHDRLAMTSWLFVHDRGAKRSYRCWYDVIITQEPLRRLHRRPLLASTASDVGAARASDSHVLEFIKAVYADATAAGVKPPNINELPALVQEMLRHGGLRASQKVIRSLANEPNIQQLRQPRGRRWNDGSCR